MTERPIYCPNCGPDPLSDRDDVRLEEHEGVLYCNATGEGGCDFHYDLKLRKRFKYKEKRFLWFWMLLCIFTLGYVEVQYREYE